MVLIIPFVVYSEYWKDIRQPDRLPARQLTLNKQHQLLLFWTKFWHKHTNRGGKKTSHATQKQRIYIFILMASNYILDVWLHQIYSRPSYQNDQEAVTWLCLCGEKLLQRIEQCWIFQYGVLLKFLLKSPGMLWLCTLPDKTVWHHTASVLHLS